MNKKNLRLLIIVAAALLAIVVAFVIVDNTSSESNYRNILVKVDSASVTKFSIISKGKKERIEMVKKGDEWTVIAGKKTFNADRMFISSLIDQLKMLKPERVVATTKDQWKQYEVDDSSSAKLTVYEGNNVVADLVIGKFNFKQSPNPYMQQNSISSYVRLVGENNVYLTNSMLSIAFMRGAEDYRDKTVVHAKVNDLKRVTFSYPGDSSFVLEKKANQWMINGIPTDSMKVANYLNQLSQMPCYDFVDDSSNVVKSQLYSLKVESTSEKTIDVVAYAADTANGTIIESTANKGARFSGKKSGLASRLFMGKTAFVK